MKYFKSDWLWLALSFLTLLFFRLPSFFDPIWYHDEAIYLAIGQNMANGGTLYVDVWDHKPPFLYLIYAASSFVFGPELWPLRVLNFLFAAITVILLYFASKNVFQLTPKIQKFTLVIATILFGVYFDTTIFNAENVFTTLVIAGLICFYRFTERFEMEGKYSWRWLSIAGLSWSLAAFTKIPALAEVLVLLGVFLAILLKSTIRISTKFNIFELIRASKILIALPYSLALILSSFVLAGLYYLLNNQFPAYIFALFGYNSEYVQAPSNPIIFGVELSISGLLVRFAIVVSWFIISTWLWLSKTSKNSLKSDDADSKGQISKRFYIFSNWFAVSVFGVFLSERPYAHYLIEVLPTTALLLGFVAEWISNSKIQISLKIYHALTSLTLLHIVFTSFSNGDITKFRAFPMAQYFSFYFSNQDNTLNSWRRAYNPFVYDRLQVLSQAVKANTSYNDKIFVIGNIPELYPQSQRVNGFKVLTDYHNFNSNRPEGNYIGQSIESVYSDLVNQNVQLIILDTESSKSRAFLNLLNKDYEQIEILQNRYQIWTKK